jgi:hypothetical protein
MKRLLNHWKFKSRGRLSFIFTGSLGIFFVVKTEAFCIPHLREQVCGSGGL